MARGTNRAQTTRTGWYSLPWPAGFHPARERQKGEKHQLWNGSTIQYQDVDTIIKSKRQQVHGRTERGVVVLLKVFRQPGKQGMPLRCERVALTSRHGKCTAQRWGRKRTSPIQSRACHWTGRPGESG